MMLAALAREMDWRRLTPETAGAADIDIARAHATDLLSDVLANAPRDGVLVTIQSHMNAVAVAVHAGIKAVVFAWGRTPCALTPYARAPLQDHFAWHIPRNEQL